MKKRINSLLFYFLLSGIAFVYGQNEKEIDVAFLTGKTPLEEKATYTLLPEVEAAFIKMSEAAEKEGIQFKVISSYRSYAHQKRIWNRKYLRFNQAGMTPQEAIEKIIEYSTIPGTSRHHWGTEVDLVDAGPKVKGDVLLDSLFHHGPYQKIRRWLEKNAAQYGFELVYTKDTLRKGFAYEPWHYSYAPLSRKFLADYITKKALFESAKDSTLLGNILIDSLFLNRYKKEQLLDIAPSLLPKSK